MSIPPARVQPRGAAEHAEALVARSKDRAKRITRRGWFVAIVGGVLVSPAVLLLVFLITAWTIGFLRGPIVW